VAPLRIFSDKVVFFQLRGVGPPPLSPPLRFYPLSVRVGLFFFPFSSRFNPNSEVGEMDLFPSSTFFVVYVGPSLFFSFALFFVAVVLPFPCILSQKLRCYFVFRVKWYFPPFWNFLFFFLEGSGVPWFRYRNPFF